KAGRPKRIPERIPEKSGIPTAAADRPPPQPVPGAHCGPNGNLRAVAHREGTPAETFALRTAGAVAAADIAVERVEGGRVAFLAIQLVDTEGNPVPIDDRPVSVTADGGARLMGLGSA